MAKGCLVCAAPSRAPRDIALPAIKFHPMSDLDCFQKISPQLHLHTGRLTNLHRISEPHVALYRMKRANFVSHKPNSRDAIQLSTDSAIVHVRGPVPPFVRHPFQMPTLHLPVHTNKNEI